jgi:hypothetical protein
MKISDLAALVQVRTHILTVINDKSVTNRDDFKPLNDARMKLDKKFVEIVKTLDMDELLIVKVSGPSTSQDLENLRDIFEASQKGQLNLPFNVQAVAKEAALGGRSEDRASSLEIADDALTEVANGEIRKLESALTKLEEQNVTITPAVVAEAAKPIQAPEEAKLAVVEKARKTKLTEASQDPDIAAAIARQKEELKIQGRANKKVKKDD